VEPIFEALSLCAALHPDPNAPVLDEDLDDAVVDGGLDGQVDAAGGDDEPDEVGRVRSDFVNDNRFAPY
jgi:chloride channel, nucleotide-sensitive, 1A